MIAPRSCDAIALNFAAVTDCGNAVMKFWPVSALSPKFVSIGMLPKNGTAMSMVADGYL